MQNKKTKEELDKIHNQRIAECMHEEINCIDCDDNSKECNCFDCTSCCSECGAMTTESCGKIQEVRGMADNDEQAIKIIKEFHWW